MIIEVHEAVEAERLAGILVNLGYEFVYNTDERHIFEVNQGGDDDDVDIEILQKWKKRADVSLEKVFSFFEVID